MKKKIFITCLVVISLFVVTGCGCHHKTKAKNCEDCVYAYYTESKEYGNKLKDYTDDYTSLKHSKFFLGHELDEYDNIKKGYVCGVENKKLFCLEGQPDNEKVYKSNKELLIKVYGKDKCSEKDINGINAMTCSGELNISMYDNTIVIGTSKSDQCYMMDNRMYCYGEK